jgi:hypothetical protein
MSPGRQPLSFGGKGCYFLYDYKGKAGNRGR